MKTLYVVADDVGMNPENDSMILAAAGKGFVDGLSIVVTGQLDELTGLINGSLSGRLGLHLNLTEGRSLSAPDAATRLTDTSGEFLFDTRNLPESIKKMRSLAETDSVFRSEALLELSTQVNRFVYLFGEPAFINYHHYLQLVSPWFDEILVDIGCSRGRCPVRGWVDPIGSLMRLSPEERSQLVKRRHNAGLPVFESIANHWMNDRQPDKKHLENFLDSIFSRADSARKADNKLGSVEVIMHIGKSINVTEPYRWVRSADRLLLKIIHHRRNTEMG